MASSLPKLTPEQFEQDRGPLAITVDVVTRTVAIAFCVLRLIARRKTKTKLWWDDWLIIWVAFFFIPAMSVEGVLEHLGLGHHLQWVLVNKPQPQTLLLYAKLAYFDQLAYPAMIGPIKVSILCLYLRIFGAQRSMWWACTIQIVMVVIWALVVFSLFAFQCKPVSEAWSPTRAEGDCFAYSPLFLGTNLVNVIMDFGILITPLPSIWQLQLKTEKKILVSAVLILGAGETAFSCIRLAKLVVLKFVDVTWDHAEALIWSTVEPAVGVICACIPILGPFLPRSCFGPRTGHSPRKGYEETDPDGNVKAKSPVWSKMSSLRFRGDETDDTMASIDEHELVNQGAPISYRDVGQQSKSGIRQTVEWHVERDSVAGGAASQRPYDLHDLS